MATLVFSAVGASLGGSLLSGVAGAAIGSAIGRAAGGLFGRHIDQMLFGSDQKAQSSQANDRIQFTNSYVGQSIPSVFGRMRIAGQVIWADKIHAKSNGENGYIYKSSFAIALCEGVVHRIGRIWANNQLVSLNPLTYRFYHGAQNQLPDPLITGIIGENLTPQFNNICYLVFEDLDLAPYGNAIPNFQFEVFRHANTTAVDEISQNIKAVTFIPGTGEYALAIKKVTLDKGFGVGSIVNAHREGVETDFTHSLNQLTDDLPNAHSLSLVVSWFGNDLRCDQCQILPKIEQGLVDGDLAWQVSGITRASAQNVSMREGSPVYGGTPCDKSVVESILAIKNRGKEIMYYPFILMDIPSDNHLPNPWVDDGFQPLNPWRGRITLPKAAGILNSTDRSAQARISVMNFLGNAQISEFSILNNEIIYSGISWGYRRFILHNAFLCKLAGGVSEFIIGSEMVGMSPIRDQEDKFPFVEGLIQLAQDAKIILGAQTKISYAADWSEYFGCQTSNNGYYFHLDNLWANENIDFIGIDNYMPLSDWRHIGSNLDDGYGSVYNLEYLKNNVAAGEGFDWYYETQADRDAQIRKPITDGASEDWIWRYKDLKNWWSKPHHHRPDGIRALTPTAWQPMSKPIRFTEYGAAAIDLSTNEPNKFLDNHSSESSLPKFSSGAQDGFIQVQYITAINQYWNDPAHNPKSPIYQSEMVDISKSYCWTWDARPWPEFPGRSEIWADANNFSTGHWLNARVNMPRLANVVAEICEQSGISNFNVRELYGLVHGIVFRNDETSRSKLEKLMRIYQFDAFVENGILTFKTTNFQNSITIDEAQLIAQDNGELIMTQMRNAENHAGKMELHFLDADREYLPATSQGNFPDQNGNDRIAVDLGAALSPKMASQLRDYLIGRMLFNDEKINFKIARGAQKLKVGQMIELPKYKGKKLFKIERISSSLFDEIHAGSIGRFSFGMLDGTAEIKTTTNISPKKIWAEFLDIPYGEGPGLYMSLCSNPWVGAAQVLEQTEPSPKLIAQFFNSSTAGKLDTSLNLASANLKQMVEIDITLSNGKLLTSNSAIQNIDNQKLAFSLDGMNWEIIGFETAQKITGNKYKLRGLYRGLHGTEHHIQSWPIHTKVIVLNSNLAFVPKGKLSASDYHQFSLGPVKDQNFWSNISYLDPVEFDRPLAPTALKSIRNDTSIQFSFSPRILSDHDNWKDVENFSALGENYEVNVKQGGNMIYSATNSSLLHNFEAVAANYQFSVRSIAQNQLKSEFIMESIYV